MHKTIPHKNREFEAAFHATLGDTAPQRPPFPGFSRFCQSLARYDVPAVADTRACYISLEKA